MSGPTESLTISITEAEDGVRLDRVLADRSGIPRARLEIVRLVADGSTARPKDRATVGMRVEAVVEDRAGSLPEPDESLGLHIVHADADVVVVDKQAGLAVHPPKGSPTRGGTLVNALLARFPEIGDLSAGQGTDEASERPGIVHRIDRMTSGLLVVARSQLALRALREQVGARAFERVYAALCSGGFTTQSGVVDAPIGRRPGSRRLTVQADGRPSRSHYRVEAEWERPALAAVSVRLETGRTHQIRVHMQAIGHPVVGDSTYGGRRLPGAGRQMLHAAHLAFTHPATGERMSFDAPLPDDMARVMCGLGEPARGTIPDSWLRA